MLGDDLLIFTQSQISMAIRTVPSGESAPRIVQPRYSFAGSTKRFVMSGKDGEAP